LNTLLILDDIAAINVVERFRSYSNITDLGTDLGTSGAFYLAAQRYFSQTPQPSAVLVGRWVKTASKGQLICATLSTAQQALAVWNAITTGAFTYTKDGGSPTTITGMNFSAAASLPAVAAIIQAALTGVTVSWNPVFSRFEFTSGTTGTTSAVSFLSTPGSGTDISATIGGRSTSSGAYVVAGLALETAASCVTLFDANYGQKWYALQLPTAVDADHLAVAALIEATSNRHVYGVSTQAAGCLVPSDTSNIAYQLFALGYKKTMTQFSSTDANAVASLIGRSITTNFQANNTVIDLMYKQEPGVVAENLNATQAAALKAINCNVFTAYSNSTNIIQWGNMCSGDSIATITGTDWLAIDIQTALYNALYTSTTRIPQTDDGEHLLVTTAESRCVQAVTNGLCAPGVWNSGGFGQINQGDFLPKGFYVYASPMALQSSADRAAGKATPIQIAAKLAGAIRTVDVLINVNR
jgi:hypothetical protein